MIFKKMNPFEMNRAGAAVCKKVILCEDVTSGMVSEFPFKLLLNLEKRVDISNM